MKYLPSVSNLLKELFCLLKSTALYRKSDSPRIGKMAGLVRKKTRLDKKGAGLSYALDKVRVARRAIFCNFRKIISDFDYFTITD